MPLYAFDCPDCGPFTAIRPMARSAEPCGCPDCGALAPRALGAPAILRGRGVGGPQRGRPKDPASATGGGHPAGCGCCVRRSPTLERVAAKGGRLFRSHGPTRAGPV